jgi:hypothetical protein
MASEEATYSKREGEKGRVRQSETPRVVFYPSRLCEGLGPMISGM